MGYIAQVVQAFTILHRKLVTKKIYDTKTKTHYQKQTKHKIK